MREPLRRNLVGQDLIGRNHLRQQVGALLIGDGGQAGRRKGQ